MDAIIERIKEAYNFKTDAEVANFLGIKPSTLSMQKNRGRLNLKRIIEKCSDLNQNWLLHGEGEKRVSSNSDCNGIPIFVDLEVSDSALDFTESSRAGNIYTKVSEEIGHLSINPDNVIGLVTSEDVMAPAVKKNDIAIIDLEEEPIDDSIFLISSPHEVILRRLKKDGGSYIAKCDNGKQQAIDLNPDDGYQLIGKLIWVLRRM